MTPAPSASFPGFGDLAGLDLVGLSPEAEAGMLRRFLDGSAEAFADTAAGVGYCAHPIRIYGSSTTVDAGTGEVLSTYSTRHDAPLGVTYLPCGNRRASVCPACSRVYAADTFHLIRSGVVGGKTVPETVADNPLVFATLTAPGFGHVHGQRARQRPCRPHRPGVSTSCPHGRPTACLARHADDDPALGSPLCPDCYDHTSHVLWQWWAPELWRRFTIALRRRIAAHLHVRPAELGTVATLQYAKVAEYQARGAVHFHALLRLDGPATADGYAPAPESLTATALGKLIRETAATVSYCAPAAYPGDPGHVLRFGRQVDARAVNATRRGDDPTQGLSAEQVAGYLAKYATKAATDTTDLGRPDDDSPRAQHYRRLRATAARLADHALDRLADARSLDPAALDDPYLLLGKWAHALGFRGHFATKSRRYSITLGALRRARRRWAHLAADAARTGRPIDTADLERRLLADDADTTLVVGSWQFAGTGWTNPGDVALALAAAARAREYDRWRADQRAARR